MAEETTTPTQETPDQDGAATQVASGASAVETTATGGQAEPAVVPVTPTPAPKKKFVAEVVSDVESKAKQVENAAASLVKSVEGDTKAAVQKLLAFPQVVTARAEVLHFASLMEERLKANDFKGDWSTATFEELEASFDVKVGDVKVAFANWKTGQRDVADLRKKVADSANYLMMILDNLKTLAVDQTTSK